jgi:hypothetical protein
MLQKVESKFKITNDSGREMFLLSMDLIKGIVSVHSMGGLHSIDEMKQALSQLDEGLYTLKDSGTTKPDKHPILATFPGNQRVVVHDYEVKYDTTLDSWRFFFMHPNTGIGVGVSTKSVEPYFLYVGTPVFYEGHQYRINRKLDVSKYEIQSVDSPVMWVVKREELNVRS